MGVSNVTGITLNVLTTEQRKADWTTFHSIRTIVAREANISKTVALRKKIL